MTGKGETVGDSRFDRRLYSAANVARYVGMHPSTLATWAYGYRRRPAGQLPVRQGPVITAFEPLKGDSRRIPFVGLVEATVVQAFRCTGLPMQRIRKALEVLSDQGELEYALAGKKLYTDGAQVLYDYARNEGDRQLRLLTVVHTGQRVFHEVIVAYLERISFDGAWADELILPVTDRKLLRARPDVASGDPLFIHGSAPLSVVRSRFEAGEPVESLAQDYGVPATDIFEAFHAIWPAHQAA